MIAPKLRFSEFTDDWQIKTLSEVSEKPMYGMNSASTDYDGSNKYLRITDIDEETHEFNQDKLTSPKDDLDEKYVLSENDLLFARTGASTGKSYLYKKSDGKVYFAGFLIKFKLKPEVNSYFIYSQTLSKNFENWVKVNSMRSGQPGINAEEYASLNVNFPRLEEQTKIAEFLSAVDDKISQLSRQLELLKQYKKGVMQKIFSQEIRFKNDNGEDFGEWDYFQASELFENYTNKNHDGNLTILAATQDKGIVPRDTIEIDIKSSEASVKSYKIIEKGQFVISLRSFQGGIEYSNYHGICSPAYTVLQPIKPINDIFYKNYLKTYDFIQRLSATVIGIRDGKQISYQAFSDLYLDYPTMPEQEKIAGFLTAIDERIDHTTAQLIHTKQWKKGLLQQMFV